MSESADALIKKYTELKDHCAAQSKKFDDFLRPFRQQMTEIENKLLEMINTIGGESIKAASGTAYTSVIVTPKVADREKYLGWLWELHDMEWEAYGDAMLQLAAPQKAALDEYMQLHSGQLPPGVSTSSFTRLNIRRS